MPSAVLGTGDTVVNQTDEKLCPDTPVGEADNKQIS